MDASWEDRIFAAFGWASTKLDLCFIPALKLIEDFVIAWIEGETSLVHAVCARTGGMTPNVIARGEQLVQRKQKRGGVGVYIHVNEQVVEMDAKVVGLIYA